MSALDTAGMQVDQYRELYFSEAHHQIEKLTQALRGLERARNDRDALEIAFRAAHTLKGMSSTMGYDVATDSASALEDMLQGVRQRSAGASSSNIFFLFRALDHLNEIIAQLEAGEISITEEPEQKPALTLEEAPAIAEPATHARLSNEQLDLLGQIALRLMASAPRPKHIEAKSYESLLLKEHLQHVQELQSAIWQIRMAPLSDIFNLYPRMLHDLARSQRKDLRVLLEGAEIEISRAVLGEINEPLLHLVRNAIVHGIEPRTERMRVGKDPRGTIRITAKQDDNALMLEVNDDGRGLDAKRILQAAYEQGFISDEQQHTMRDQDAFQLIMLPGFSLSAEVTSYAGRGVGMGAVQSQVEALRGSLAIHSEFGQGTTFTLQLPRAGGPIETELVRVDEQIYALPIARIEFQMTVPRIEIVRQRTGESTMLAPDLRLYTLRELLAPTQARRESFAQCGVIGLKYPLHTALCVDELLGKALWFKESSDQDLIPLLDLDQLLRA